EVQRSAVRRDRPAQFIVGCGNHAFTDHLWHRGILVSGSRSRSCRLRKGKDCENQGSNGGGALIDRSIHGCPLPLDALESGAPSASMLMKKILPWPFKVECSRFPVSA